MLLHFLHVLRFLWSLHPCAEYSKFSRCLPLKYIFKPTFCLQFPGLLRPEYKCLCCRGFLEATDISSQQIHFLKGGRGLFNQQILINYRHVLCFLLGAGNHRGQLQHPGGSEGHSGKQGSAVPGFSAHRLRLGSRASVDFHLSVVPGLFFSWPLILVFWSRLIQDKHG